MFIRICSAFFLTVFLISCGGGNNPNLFEKKFNNLNEFAEWFIESKNISGDIKKTEKLYGLVQAVDGGVLVIGTHKVGECYVFMSKESFDALDPYIENIDKLMGSNKKSEVDAYFNVKCVK